MAFVILYCTREANWVAKPKVPEINKGSVAAELVGRTLVLPAGSAGREPVTSW